MDYSISNLAVCACARRRLHSLQITGCTYNTSRIIYRSEKNFSEAIVFSCVCDFVIRPEKFFSEGYCFELCLWFYYSPGKEFFRRIMWFFFLFFFLFLGGMFVCGHDNSWKVQPIQTKFPHMVLEWNSSSKFEDGHRMSHVNPPKWGLLPPEN